MKSSTKAVGRLPIGRSRHGGAMRAIRQDRVVVGGPEDFMEVRHLVLAGTNEEIGHALTALAIERFGLVPEASTDRLRTRVQRHYIEMNYPILHERMRGVATALGKRLDDDAWNFRTLEYLLGPPPGCSVVYYPPGMTADGHRVISRNYDYGTGTSSTNGRSRASCRPIRGRTLWKCTQTAGMPHWPSACSTC